MLGPLQIVIVMIETVVVNLEIQKSFGILRYLASLCLLVSFLYPT